MDKPNTRKKSFAPKRLLLILCAFAALLLIGLLLYFVTKNGDSLPSSASPSPQPNTSPTATTTPASPVSDTSTLKIAQLGVEIKNIPTELLELSYTVGPSTSDSYTRYTNVTFSSNILKDNCPADSYPLGNLTRGEGTYNNNPHMPLIKQFSDFWVTTQHVQSTCPGDQQTYNEQANILYDVISNPNNLQTISH